MARAVRFSAALLLSAAAALAPAGWRPAWLEALGVELAPPARAGGLQVCEAGEESRRTERRLAAREQVVGWLLAGELSLPEAAAYIRFFYRDALRRGIWLQHLPGATEEEETCRLVIAWARAQTPHAARAAVSARLEAELAAHLRRPSGVPVALR